MLTQYRSQIVAVSLIIVASIIALALLGRVWWCETVDAWPLSLQVNSRHNSQHVLDPYTFTHVLHGIMEFWLIGLVFRKVPMAWRFVIAIFIESSWEVLENTNYIINRYREATISLDYFGDSIVNSLADIVSCGIGFAIAHRVRLWWSAAIFFATEAILLIFIRDSLLLNLLMLVWPLEGVRQWQMGL